MRSKMVVVGAGIILKARVGVDETTNTGVEIGIFLILFSVGWL